jgi:DNA-binding GntR family transcriptional regulator
VAPRGTSQRIAEDLRHRIRDGVLAPGSLLPSEAQLCEQYDVARGTARAALALLVDDGLVDVVPGVGRRVAGGTGADRTTAYGRIAGDLAEQIRAGTLAPDAPLPSEAAVMEQYDVSRNTARRAFKVLAESGVVVVRHGVGAFVRPAES